MSKLFRALLTVFLLVTFPLSAEAARARLCESVWAGLRDNTGNVLGDGTVTFYEAGTTTPKAIYTVQDKSVSATNPFELDSAGRGSVFGDGLYKIVVKDSGGATIQTIDNFPCSAEDGRNFHGGTTGGTTTAFTLTPAPAAGSYDDGDTYTFFANATNTGASTLNVSALGAKALRKQDGSVALAAGDMVSGNLYIAVFRTSLDVFVLQNPKVQDNFNLGTTTGSANAYVATPTVPLSAYVDGQIYSVEASFDSTAAATINVSSLGAKTIKKQIYGISYDIIEADIASGQHLLLKYDGTDMILLNPMQPNVLVVVNEASSETTTSTAVVQVLSTTVLANTMRDGARFRIRAIVEVYNASGGSVNYVARAVWGATNMLATANIAVATGTNRGTIWIDITGTSTAVTILATGLVFFGGDASDSTQGQMRTNSTVNIGSGVATDSFASNQTLAISMQMGTSSANARFRIRQAKITFE